MSFARRFAAAFLLVALATLAFATAPTALVPAQLKQNNYQVQAGDLTLASTAMDATNGNSYPFTAREILIIQNSDSAAHTFSITNCVDNYGSTNSTLTNYSVAATGSVGSQVIIEMTLSNGWTCSGNTINLTTSSALLKISVVRF
jgi:hypothetical protein